MKEFLFLKYCHILGRFARKYIRSQKPLIIGINGSVGKTSCRMIIRQLLKEHIRGKIVYTSPKNFNGELGLSASIFRIEAIDGPIGYLKALRKALVCTLSRRRLYDIIVLEYGIDHIGEMDFILSIAKPDIGVFTSVDKVHCLQFGDPDTLAREEAKMAKKTKRTVFLNASDPYALQLTKQINVDCITYHTHANPPVVCNISHTAPTLELEDGKAISRFTITSGNNPISIQTNLLTQESLGYIGVGLTILELLCYQFQITNPLAGQKKLYLPLMLQSGRCTILQGIHNSLLVDSTYNAAPMSVRSLIDLVVSLKKNCYPEHELILVVGEMRELGDFQEQEHRLIAGPLSQAADRLVLIGASMIDYTADELRKINYPQDRVTCFVYSTDAGEHLREHLAASKKPALILFKGSQNTIFTEEALKRVLLDPNDVKLLPRQSRARMAKKKARFNQRP